MFCGGIGGGGENWNRDSDGDGDGCLETSRRGGGGGGGGGEERGDWLGDWLTSSTTRGSIMWRGLLLGGDCSVIADEFVVSSTGTAASVCANGKFRWTRNQSRK